MVKIDGIDPAGFDEETKLNKVAVNSPFDLSRTKQRVARAFQGV
jgi:hypothetical protein